MGWAPGSMASSSSQGLGLSLLPFASSLLSQRDSTCRVSSFKRRQVWRKELHWASHWSSWGFRVSSCKMTRVVRLWQGSLQVWLTHDAVFPVSSCWHLLRFHALRESRPVFYTCQQRHFAWIFHDTKFLCPMAPGFTLLSVASSLFFPNGISTVWESKSHQDSS